MNIPVVKASRIMNSTVLPSGAPGQSGLARVLRRSFINQIELLLGQNPSLVLELLRVNAGGVLADGSLPEVEDFDEVKHPERGAIIEFQFEDNAVLWKRGQVRRQIRPPAAVWNLEPAGAVVTTSMNVAI